MFSNKLKSNSEFISEATKVHKDYYDYSKTKYINAKTKVSIVCPVHGEFEQNPRNHLRGRGCHSCGIIKQANSKTKSFDEFKTEALKAHGDRYSYKSDEYVNLETPINIKCSIHGYFSQNPEKHLMGRGCRKCAKNHPLTTEIFIERSNVIHKNKYDYSLTKFVGASRNLKIICPIHGVFEQRANAHLRGCNCSKCTIHSSQGEIEVRLFIQALGYSTVMNNRGIINPFELDIFIPELNKAIEFNGVYWHYSKRHFVPGKHSKKSNMCKGKGIKLLHLREELWVRDKEKMKMVIKEFLK